MPDQNHNLYAGPGAIVEDAPDPADPLRKALRFGIVVWWISLPFSIMLATVSDSLSPEELQGYVEAQMLAESSATSLFWLAFVLLFLLGSVVGSLGLYFAKPWGAWLFFSAQALSYTVPPFGGPYIEHGIGTLGDIEVIIVGYIIGVVYCMRMSRSERDGQAA